MAGFQRREHLPPDFHAKYIFEQGQAVVSAPPVLIASNHSVDYTCGNCDTILMHADHGQVHNLVIRCTQCGSYNTTNS